MAGTAGFNKEVSMAEEKSLTVMAPHEIEGGKVYQALKTKCLEILKTAKAHVVRSQPTMDKAAEYKTSLKALLKAVGTEKKALTGPVEKRKKEIIQLFKELEGPLSEADTVLDERMSAFQREHERIEREKEERDRKRQEEVQRLADEEARKAQEALDKAETEEEVEAATEKVLDAEDTLTKAYEPPKPVGKPVERIRRTAGGGSVSFRKDPQFEVVDESLLPREYLMPDLGKIGKVVRAGIKNIAGVRIWEKTSTRTRAVTF